MATGTCARCRKPGELKSRGLCQKCESRSRYDGTLIDYPRAYRRKGEWVEDYEFLLAQYGDAFGAIAARLGVSALTLERALRRDGYVCKTGYVLGSERRGIGSGGRKVMVPREKR